MSCVMRKRSFGYFDRLPAEVKDALNQAEVNVCRGLTQQEEELEAIGWPYPRIAAAGAAPGNVALGAGADFAPFNTASTSR
jgi:hypothetical protein